MTSSVLKIQNGNFLDFKTLIKAQIGRSLATLCPKRARTIYRQPILGCRSLIDRSMRFYLRNRSIRENQDRFLARLHSEFWSGDGGVVFSENCDDRFEDYFMRHHAIDFNVLKDTWERRETVSEIVEIGTCSGLLLDHMCNQFSGVQQAVGLDLNPIQIEKNQSAFETEVMSFEVADGIRWITDNAKPGTLFVSNGGVLEYFPQSRIESLLRHIASNLRPAILFCSEPIAQDFDLEAHSLSVPFGDELSFSHNYPGLMEQHGFKVLSCREAQCEEYRMLTTIAEIS